MENQIEFEFEELPLVVAAGFECGLVNGMATIAYENDGEWSLRELALDGYKQLSADEKAKIERHLGMVVRQYVEKPVVIDRAEHPWLYGAILDQLENGRFASSVADKINKALEDAGVSRRDPNLEHSTLNRAQQGV